MWKGRDHPVVKSLFRKESDAHELRRPSDTWVVEQRRYTSDLEPLAKGLTMSLLPALANESNESTLGPMARGVDDTEANCFATLERKVRRKVSRTARR